MKAFKKSVLAITVALVGACFVSCNDANEFEDAQTSNPAWVDNYTDSLNIPHPETVANTKWVRGTGLKVNAYGEEVQGFVESLDFISDNAVVVKMSEGATSGTWIDDSNTEALPYYEYTYSSVTGKVDILKEIKDDSGKVSKVTLFTGIVVSDKKEVMTVVHYGDTPVQSYLIKQ